ncbi:TerD family protein [Streptomyces sp. NPDC001380]|uniref:TerD family protein n=1 Tax=Streptomyces sp. NPDC001380 TaxID=3364566 RepID=UPI00367BF8D8
MHEMPKGANIGLAALSEDVGSVQVGLRWSDPSGTGEADVSVLLLGPDGRVRSDDDFYFYNHPTSADGSVQVLGQTATADGSEDRVSLDLAALPADVERVVIAASRYGGARFGDLQDLRLVLADASGESLLGFSIEDATVETAFVFGEIYRRGGDWKFRAVGQGYRSGLAGLATDHGIDVNDDEAAAPTAAGTGEDGAEETAGAAGTEAAAADGPARVPRQATAGRAPDGAVPAAPARPGASAAAASAAAAASSGPDPAPQRVRITRKKVTLPRAPRPSLAENDSWRGARLFPASALKNDREREGRATSVLLSVMAQVPEFGRRLTAGFNAPAGTMETFVEASFTHGATAVRPDGVIRVSRAGKIWTALVEVKTNGNPLKTDQVQAYADIAARRGYEAVVTLSNDVALHGIPLVDVKVDGRRRHKVALWHLSWAEVAYQAQMLIRHEGVGSPAHAWLLQELLHYLQHENSGCHGFQNMGASWVPVRTAVDDDTLRPGDARAVEVVQNWERLIQQVCLRLGGELGCRTAPVRPRRGTDPHARCAALADRLAETGRLQADIHVENAPGTLSITADLRSGKLRTSVEIPSPEQGYPLSRAKRLMRQLAEAPADLHVESLLDTGAAGPRGTLEKLRPEPGDLVPRDGGRITGFRLTLSKSIGLTRGNAETGFIRSVDTAVGHFHAHVVAQLGQPVPRRPADAGV